MSGSVRVQCRHPDAEKSAPRIDRHIYDAVRKAILAVVPKRGAGLPFRELADRVEERLPHEVLAAMGSVSWYATTIKLDLEARGQIERVTGVKPQRLRRR